MATLAKFDRKDPEELVADVAAPVLPPGPAGFQGPAPVNKNAPKFTNVTQYLEANKDFAKDRQYGSGLGGIIRGDVTHQSNVAGSKIDAAKKQFEDASKQGTINYDRQMGEEKPVALPGISVMGGPQLNSENAPLAKYGAPGQIYGSYPEGWTLGQPVKSTIPEWKPGDPEPIPPGNVQTMEHRGTYGELLRQADKEQKQKNYDAWVKYTTGQAPASDPNNWRNIFADPTKATDEDISKFQKIQSGIYGGPKELQNQKKIDQGLSNLKTTAKQVQDEKGRFSLLKNMFNRPTYTSGQQKLDNLLLQGSLGQNNVLGNIKAEASRALAGFNQAKSDAQAIAGTAENRSRLSGQNAREDISTVAKNTANLIQQKADAVEKGRMDEVAAINQQLANNQLKMEYMQLAGLQNGQPIYDVNLGQFFKPFTSDYTEGQLDPRNVASAEDYAKIAALKKIAGQYALDDSQKVFDDYSDLSKAGKYEQNRKVVIDPAEVQGAVRAAAERDMASYKAAEAPYLNALYALQRKWPTSDWADLERRLVGGGWKKRDGSLVDFIKENVLGKKPDVNNRDEAIKDPYLVQAYQDFRRAEHEFKKFTDAQQARNRYLKGI